MALYQLGKQKICLIEEKKIDLEKNIQGVIENNLDEIFGLQFVCSELPLHNFRIDTLAFDEETKSFVIIEYKRDKSISIVDQGFSYLALMINNKADFVLEYNEKLGKNLNKTAIDWSQSRVVFIANSFTTYQQNAINFKDLPIELYEVKIFEDDILSINQLKPISSTESIKTISKSKNVETVSKEIKIYTVEDHFKPGWEKSRELFDDLREKILGLDDRIEEKFNKPYIGYQVGRKNIVAVIAQKQKLIFELNRTDIRNKEVKDPEKKVYYRKDSKEYFNQHISRFDINNFNDVDYAVFLAKQVWERFFK
ncbi:MAG: DUF5655 domain-containing protein [Patescibacteria group bacterium]